MPQDPATGLVDMGARSYNPSTSAFTAEDTIIGDLAAPISLNRYTYANGAPLDYYDPDGHLSFSLGGIVKSVGSALSSLGSKLVDGAKKGASVVRNALSSGGSAVASAVSTATSAVTGAVSGAANAAASRARSSVKAFQQMFDDANLGASAQHTLASARGQLKSLAQSLDQAGAHEILTVAGFVPGPIGAASDVANAALYFIEGDTKNALISLAATVVPIAGAAMSEHGE